MSTTTHNARGVPSKAALQAHLSEILPPFMIPSAFVVLDALPLSPNGKVDLSALPPPTLDDREGPSAALEDGLERLVARVWSEVIGHPVAARHQNFFEAGGSSLGLAQVQARLTETVGTVVPMAALLEHPTVATLAAHLRAAQADRGGGPGRSSAVEERAAKQRAAVAGAGGRRRPRRGAE